MNLALVYARYQILENIRVPIAVISSAMFPALSLLFFVVPFDYAQEPTSATTAVAQLTVFSVMSSMLFTYGIGIAEERERSWDPYLRTLPAGAQPRIAGRFATGAVFMLLGLVPLLLVGAFGTAATITPTRLLLGIGSLLIAALPFLFGGLAIGYSLSAKAAGTAVTRGAGTGGVGVGGNRAQHARVARVRAVDRGHRRSGRLGLPPRRRPAFPVRQGKRQGPFRGRPPGHPGGWGRLSRSRVRA